MSCLEIALITKKVVLYFYIDHTTTLHWINLPIVIHMSIMIPQTNKNMTIKIIQMSENNLKVLNSSHLNITLKKLEATIPKKKQIEANKNTFCIALITLNLPDND